MLLQLVLYVDYLMVRAMMIYSRCSLPLSDLFLEDPLTLIICQILLKHLDSKIPSHSRLWTAIAKVGVVRFRHCGTVYLLIYY